MTITQFVIDIRLSGEKTVQRGLAKTSKEADRTRKSLALLRSGLVVLASVRVAQQFIEYADTLTSISNKIRLVTTSTEQFEAVQRALFAVAQETRTGFEETATLFNRLARSVGGLDLTYRDLLTITRTVNQTLAISGATSQEARNGLIQFAQGLASGTLRGDELRSVVEQLPALADVISEKFGKAGGALIALAKANDGILETKLIIEALQEGAVRTATQFAKTTITAQQAFVKFNNSLILFFGGLAKSADIGVVLDKVLTVIARNLIGIIAALSTLAGVAAFNLLIGTGQKFIGTLIGIASAIKGNIVGAFVLLKNVAVGTGKAIAVAFNFARVSFLRFFITVVAIPAAIIAILVGIGFLITELTGVTNGFDDVKKAADSFFGGVLGLFAGIAEAASQIPAAIGDAFVQAVNFAIKQLIRLRNFGAKIANVFGADIDIVKPEDYFVANKFEGALAKVKEIIARNIKEGAEQGLSGNKTLAAIKDFGNDFGKLLGLSSEDAFRAGALDDKIKGKGSTDEIDPKEAEKLRDAFKDLVSELDPLVDFTQQYDESLKSLKFALSENTISTERYNELIILTTRSLAGFNNDQFEAARSAEVASLAFKAGAGNLTEYNGRLEELALKASKAKDEIKALIDPYNAYARSLKEASAQAKLANASQEDQSKFLIATKRELAGVGNASVEYAANVKILDDALASSAITLQEYESRLRDVRLEFLDTQQTASAGFETAFLDLEASVADASIAAEELLTKAFKAAEDSVVEFVQEGTFSLRKLGQEYSEFFLRLGTRQALTGIGNAFGFGEGVQGGGFGLGSLFGDQSTGQAQAGATGTAIQTAFTSGSAVANAQINAAFLSGASAAAAQLATANAAGATSIGSSIVSSSATGGQAMQQGIQQGGNSFLSSLSSTFDGIISSLGSALGSLFSGGGGGGGLGGLFSSFFGGGGGLGATGSTTTSFGAIVPSFAAFQRGGQFEVGSDTSAAQIPGIDNRLVAFRAQDGEKVTITPKNETAPNPVPTVNQVFNIQTPDADSFQRSRSQIAARSAAGLQQARGRR